MSRAYLVSTFRSIRRTLSRFLSIVAIVALGTSFFVGFKAAYPDMVETADTFYTQNNLFDIRLQSYIGIYDEDLDKVRQLDGVKNVTGQKFVDGYVQMLNDDAVPAYEGLVDIDGSEMTLRAYALDVDAAIDFTNGKDDGSYISRVTLLEGEYPDEVGECVVTCSPLTTPPEFIIGEKIKIVGDNENILYSLAVDEFTIVGIIRTPNYVSFERGATLAGSGKLGDYIFIPKETFTEDVKHYSEAYVTLEDSDKYEAYSDEYDEYVNAKADEILQASEAIVAARAKKLDTQMRADVISGEAELAKAKQEVEVQLKDARDQLEDLREMAANGDQMIVDAKTQLETQYSDAIGQLTSGSEQYNVAVKEYNDAAYLAAEKQVEWDLANKEFQTNTATYDAAVIQLGDAKTQITVAQTAVYGSKELISSVESLLLTLKANQDVSISDLDLDAMADRLQETNPELADIMLAASNLTAQGTAADAIVEVEKTLDQKKLELAASELELEDAKAQYNAKEAELTAAKRQLDVAKVQLDQSAFDLKEAQKKLEAYKEQIQDSGLTLQFGSIEARTAYLTAQAEIALKQAQLAQAKEYLVTYEELYEKREEEAYDSLSLAETQVKKGRGVLDNLADACWFVYTRYDSPGYSGYGDAANSMKSLSNVFPVFFFVVSTLVCLTTMTRMVEEERIQLGTLKALGYTNAGIVAKYMIYAFLASMIGSVIGIPVGFWLFPTAFNAAWGIIYEMPTLIIRFLPLYTVLGLFIAVLSTMGAVMFACRKELVSVPSVLMRPKPPKIGKRVILERVTFIWRKLNFTSKVTVRNLFRSKKRFIMTTFGIAGCTALILASLGLGNSADSIIQGQYGENGIAQYDIQVVLKEAQDPDKESKVLNKINAMSDMGSTMLTYMKVCRGSSPMWKDDVEVNIFIPQSSNKIGEFVQLLDYKTGKVLTLSDKGAIITDSYARKAGVSVGEYVTVSWVDGAKTVEYDLLVEGIVENHTFHYVYMTDNYYESVVGERVELNYLVGKLKDGVTPEGRVQLETALNEIDEVNGSVYTTVVINNFENIVKSLNLIITVLIVAAAALAFVVLYNLNNININERVRELATLKVLGFYDKEVSAYIYRENVILTLFGIFFGIFMGMILHRVVVNAVEIDAVTFGREIEKLSYLLSLAMTSLFAILVNLLMHKKLKKVSMVESLKSVE